MKEWPGGSSGKVPNFNLANVEAVEQRNAEDATCDTCQVIDGEDIDTTVRLCPLHAAAPALLALRGRAEGLVKALREITDREYTGDDCKEIAFAALAAFEKAP